MGADPLNLYSLLGPSTTGLRKKGREVDGKGEGRTRLFSLLKSERKTMEKKGEMEAGAANFLKRTTEGDRVGRTSSRN